MNAEPPSARATPLRAANSRALQWLLALTALSLAAALFPKLSFPAAFLCLVAVVGSPKLKGTAATTKRILLIVSIAGATVGLLRFVLVEAIPGVLSGGKSAIEKQAVSFLRTIVTAQDHSRSMALLDPDGDGTGSALGLRELAGIDPLPGGQRVPNPPLSLRAENLQDTALGLAVSHSGYFVKICLPDAQGGWVDEPSARDAERSERQYGVYAWPREVGPGSPSAAYYCDAREAITMLLAEPGSQPRYVGAPRPPPCEAALVEKDWQVWKDKQPRSELPGDSPLPSQP